MRDTASLVGSRSRRLAVTWGFDLLTQQGAMDRHPPRLTASPPKAAPPRARGRSEDTSCDNDTPHGDNPPGFGYILPPLRPRSSRARLARAAVPGRPDPRTPG